MTPAARSAMEMVVMVVVLGAIAVAALVALGREFRPRRRNPGDVPPHQDRSA